MKKVLYIIIPLAIIAIVIIKLKNNKDIVKDKVYQYDKEQAINVTVETIKAEMIGAEFSYSGTFEPNKETKLSAEIQGKINDVFVDVGSSVLKGQSLIQLDNSLLKLQLQTAEVQIEGLEADVKRFTVLANADAVQGIQVEKAELGLKSAKIQRATLLEQINKTTIKAPFEGLVTAKLTEEGAFAAPGVPLLQITDITKLKFTVNVSENDLNLFDLNQVFSIGTDVYPDILLSGKASMIGSKANMGSSFPIQFIVNNTSDLKIKSGMFGKVNLKSEKQKLGIIIPASAIIGSANQTQVYKVEKGKAILHSVTIAQKIKNKVVVSSGLNEGDVIVTNGFINLFNDANVTVN
ncbi:MAG: efflux RND transporter periplasmic adaptor subunit [Bacteroidetes bacterium]|nr:efflux RND transporter periplasmic adaptor subunit [Bacteroidota bacterium]